MVRCWVAERRLVSFAVLAYAFSWAWWVPLAMGGDTVGPGIGWPTHLPGLLGPLAAALVVTAIVDGRQGLREFRGRLWRWRVSWPWWSTVAVVLLVGAAAVGVLALAGRAVPSVADLTRYNGIPVSWGAPAVLVTSLLVNGVGEEAGWRGFAVEHLMRGGRGVVRAASIVAAVWAGWHLPLFFLVSSFEGFGPVMLGGWLIGLVAGSVVLAWIYHGGQHSILLVAAWHTAFNLTAGTAATDDLVAPVTSTLVMVAAAVIALRSLRSRRHGSRLELTQRTSSAARGGRHVVVRAPDPPRSSRPGRSAGDHRRSQR